MFALWFGDLVGYGVPLRFYNDLTVRILFATTNDYTIGECVRWDTI